jgi:hypothetical protein
MEETTGQMLAFASLIRELVTHTLSDQTVQVLVVGALNAEVTAADVVNGLVVDHEGAVGVLKSGVSGEDGVVRLDNGGGDLRSWVDAELKLALLAVVDGEALHEEGTETGTGTTTEGVEDEEALEARAVVGDMAHLVEDLVNELLADGVVATGVVVRGILLAGDHLLRVEERAVGAGADLIDDVGLKIAVDGAGHVLAIACMLELVFRCRSVVDSMLCCGIPVSEKKVEKPWSSLAALRSSVRKPSGYISSASRPIVCYEVLH